MTTEEIKKLATAISENLKLCHKEVLTFDEALQYMGLSSSTLYKLTSGRQIPHSKPNGKLCFFKRAELDAWLMSNPVATNAELNGRALAYCMLNPNPLTRKRTK